MVELFIINFNLRENKNMDTIMIIVFLISFVGIQVCEPAQPKKDKRFKTGYKNNESDRWDFSDLWTYNSIFLR